MRTGVIRQRGCLISDTARRVVKPAAKAHTGRPSPGFRNYAPLASGR
jgi:hypothetical protein